MEMKKAEKISRAQSLRLQYKESRRPSSSSVSERWAPPPTLSPEPNIHDGEGGRGDGNSCCRSASEFTFSASPVGCPEQLFDAAAAAAAATPTTAAAASGAVSTTPPSSSTTSPTLSAMTMFTNVDYGNCRIDYSTFYYVIYSFILSVNSID